MCRGRWRLGSGSLGAEVFHHVGSGLSVKDVIGIKEEGIDSDNENEQVLRRRTIDTV